MDKAFFIDTSRCTACRGCQVACKQWHKLPAEKTVNVGSFQNPQDLSFHTYKLVRFSEGKVDGKLRWLFFPDQCRHCIIPPCKEVADGYDESAIIRDAQTNAVLFTANTAKLTKDQRQEVREACPYDIPREDPTSGVMGKCDMCVDRVHNGLKPACVLSCPTGAMNFGDRDAMLAQAKAVLAEVRKRNPKAMLLNAEDVNTIYLVEHDPKHYHDKAVAEGLEPALLTRKQFFAKVFGPARSLT